MKKNPKKWKIFSISVSPPSPCSSGSIAKSTWSRGTLSVCPSPANSWCQCWCPARSRNLQPAQFALGKWKSGEAGWKWEEIFGFKLEKTFCNFYNFTLYDLRKNWFYLRAKLLFIIHGKGGNLPHAPIFPLSSALFAAEFTLKIHISLLLFAGFKKRVRICK